MTKPTIYTVEMTEEQMNIIHNALSTYRDNIEDDIGRRTTVHLFAPEYMDEVEALIQMSDIEEANSHRPDPNAINIWYD